jgi:hypothetical protein
MRWRFAGCTVPLAVLALGIGVRGVFPAPLMQPALGEGTAPFQRVDAQRPSNNPLKRCLTRKGEPSCHSAAAKAAKNAQAPQLPEYPGAAGSAAATDPLPLPSKPPPGRSNANHQNEHGAGAAPAGDGGPSPGFKFTGGMGVPNNRATLEGALSPYQQPNGNTSASQSGKLTNGLETQGMHFGFEYHY